MRAFDSGLSRSVGALTFVGALVGGAAVTAGPAAAAGPATIVSTIDDGAASGAQHFWYSGSWLVCKGCRVSGYGGSFHYSSRVGSVAGFSFTGTRVTLYGVRQPSGGIATVLVDGVARGTVNFSASSTRSAAVYTSPVLRNGRHSVTLKVTSRTPGTRRTISLDRAVVTAPRPPAGGVVVVPAPAPPAPPDPVKPAPRPVPRPPSGGGGGVASFTFDDGLGSQFANARPALRAAGVHGTFYLISDAFGWGSGSMSAADARRLAAEGDEIGNHTRDHGHLATLSADAVQAEFATAQSVIRDQVGVTPTSCAYPYGESNDTVQQVAAKYFSSCRGTSSGTNSSGGLSRYDLRVFYVHTSTSADDVRAAAAAARANGTWVIFVYHGVGSIGSADDVSAESFQAQLQAVVGTGISVRTVGQAVGALD